MKSAFLLTLIATTSAMADAGVPTVVYSSIDSSPTSLVPGQSGLRFTDFFSVYRSPNGERWIMYADTSAGGFSSEITMTGQVDDASGTVVMFDGSHGVMGINDSGQYVFVSGSYVKKWDGSQFITVAQVGSPLPSPFETENHFVLRSPSIWNDGTVSYKTADTQGPLPPGKDDFLIAGNDIIAQQNTTSPANQPNGENKKWQIFTGEGYRSNSPTEHFIMGYLQNGPLTVAINGSVVLQSGLPIPNSGIPHAVQGLDVVFDSAGNWLLTGEFDNSDEFIVMNGNLLAKTGDSVPGGLPLEVFDDVNVAQQRTFNTMASNNQGHVVYSASTKIDAESSGVAVFNNQSVVLRYGDAVDVDGNGLLDNDAYISSFFNFDALGRDFLTDDGQYWVIAALRTGAGAGLGDAVIRIDIPLPVCPADLTGNGGVSDGQVGPTDLFLLLSNWNTDGPGASLAAPTNVVNVADLFVLLAAWGACN